MSNKLSRMAMLAGLAVLSGVATAGNTIYTSNPERNDFVQAAPAYKTSAEVAYELADFRKNPISADRWQYVGGEHEWAKIPHTYAIVGGKLEHTDACDHTSGPIAGSLTPSPYPDLYRNVF